MRCSLAVVVVSVVCFLGCGGDPGVGGTGGGGDAGGSGGAAGGGTGGGSAGGGSAGGGSATGGGTGGGSATGGGAGGGSAGGGAGGGAATGLPCDVAQVLATRCTVCHGAVLAGAAPMPLLTYKDLSSPSPVDPNSTVAARSILRMKAAIAPMPPVPHMKATAAEIAILENWFTKDGSAGRCVNPAPEGSSTAGAAPEVCTSGTKWAGGTQGSTAMEPGLACRSCHLGSNFMAQNPTGVSKPSRAYFFMGTVYGDFHEQDKCNAKSIPAGTVVEILDSTGAVKLTLAVNSVGNFYSGTTAAGISLPYTARVTSKGMTRTMITPQMNGDCNTCHTSQGLLDAPGRIVYPF